jgi:hypothetical protein
VTEEHGNQARLYAPVVELLTHERRHGKHLQDWGQADLASLSLASANIWQASGRYMLDINQAAYIDNAPVLGAGAGEGALGSCTAVAADHGGYTSTPEVKVCGTGIQITLFRRDPLEAARETLVCVLKKSRGQVRFHDALKHM